MSVGLGTNFVNILEEIRPVYTILTIPLNKLNIITENLEAVLAMFPSDSEKLDIYSLQSELEVLFSLCSELKSFPEFFKTSFKFKNNLKQAFLFSCFVLTVSYGVSSNERTFSHLKFVKNALRTTMTDERLDNLMLIKCEADIATKLDLEKVISTWATLKTKGDLLSISIKEVVLTD